MAIHIAKVNASIRAEMARAGETQTTFAAKLGVSQGSVSRRLTGDADWTVPEIIRAAEILNVPLSALLPEVAA